jgi:hypothetical protein
VRFRGRPKRIIEVHLPQAGEEEEIGPRFAEI